MEAGSCSVHILGITANPDGPQTVQQTRNLLTGPRDRAADFRFLVRDRSGQFTASFDEVLADAGIEAVKMPPRCPRANAYAERFVLIFGQRHLRTVLAEYETPYSGRRPTAAATSARPGPISRSLASPRSGSSPDPSSAVSSTSTSAPHRNLGQDQWPNFGTP
jgi:putative transposase